MERVPNPSAGIGPWRPLLWAFVALMALHAGYKITTGTWLVWAECRDWDLQTRANEYTLFRAGVYPHWQVEEAPRHLWPAWSVYPPYAFPMLAPFFEPGGLEQGRYVVWFLSIAALVLMAFFAHRVLRPYGPEVAAIGAAAAFTISGNKGAFVLGQFSILCTGFVFLQMAFLARGRPLLAGACWTLAMLKPHLALPFAALFLLRRGQWPGLATGLASLAALSWFACAWTGIPVTGIVDHWLRGMSLDFAERGLSVGTGSFAKWLGIDHRLVVFPVFGVALGLAMLAVVYLRRLGPPAMLPIAGLCSVIGMLGVYHWMYDQIMLFPAVLATLAVAAATRGKIAILVAAAMLASLLPPMRWVEKRVVPETIMACTWLVAGIYPMVALIVASRRGKALAS